MRVLVLGGGAREHALCWRLHHSVTVEEVICAPGNVGVAAVARLREVDLTSPAAVTALALDEGVDLVVVGPEQPLVAGVTDALRAKRIPVFGPSSAAARIESSKAYAKRIMTRAGVPTAESWSGDDLPAALAALDRFGPPYVVKVDGLAGGKGVTVTEDRAEAEQAVRAALVEGAFGAAGFMVLVEAFVAGPELSVFALTDGDTVLLLDAARDYKRAGDGDGGANTGGMGAYSPVPGVEDVLATVSDSVFAPVVAGLREQGTPYVGVLYAGLILSSDGPRVLEFNARFGDPEAQVLLPRLQADFAALLAACAHGELGGITPPRWDPRSCVTVVLASEGYPGEYQTGVPISGLDGLAPADSMVFHGGTRRDGEAIVTAGGRVLSVSAFGDTLAAARTNAYAAADGIDFAGRHQRSDIAAS